MLQPRAGMQQDRRGTPGVAGGSSGGPAVRPSVEVLHDVDRATGGLELLDESEQPADALPSGATLTVRVRLRPALGVTPDQAWEQVAAELEHLFRTHQVYLTLERAEEAPAPSLGGKYRLVHPLPSVD